MRQQLWACADPDAPGRSIGLAPPPCWATTLVGRMSLDYSVEEPTLNWRTRRQVSSSGYCNLNGRVIGIGAGSDVQDSRLAVLHEMAHLILIQTVDAYQGEHDDCFYDFFWPVIRKYRFPVGVARDYEAEHHRRVVTRTYRRGGGRLRF